MAKKKTNLKTKKPISKTSAKKNTVKKTSKKTSSSKKKTISKTVKKSTKIKKTAKVSNKVKKKVTVKKKKEIKKVKSKIKVEKKVINKSKTKIEKKPKKVLSFEDHIKEVIAKLLDKHKVDGIYTSKIIEKAVPKKFRIPENIVKVEDFLKNSNITIVSEKEAAALNKAAKEESLKKDEDTSEEEKKQTGKTDDPVRLYLRDMGAVELLSREGEIAIAKRIEAGREKMIGAICESPMTIRSIINWKDSIKEGTMLLRDIVDLEATYDMSDIGESKIDDTLQLIEGASKKEDKLKDKKNKSNDKHQEENTAEVTEDDDEEEGLNVSLAAMEEKLKPKVLNDFDDITKLFKKLQKSSLDLINSDSKNTNAYLSLEKKYKKIQKEMVIAMKAVHFNSSTIEALMESLYELNKKLLVREGRMLRLATGEGVKRESFIEHYLNFNFEKNWIQNLLNLNDKNWEKFINKNHIEINKLIDEIKEIQDAS
jgi:RNA polymerase primary sigma factor